MCTLENLKKQNEEEHKAITDKLNQLEPKINAPASISQTTKWIAGGLLVLIVALLSSITIFSGMTYKATAHAQSVELSSFKRLNALQDTIAAHWQIETKRYKKEIKPQEIWTHEVAKSYIMPAYHLSIKNKKKIDKICKQISN